MSSTSTLTTAGSSTSRQSFSYDGHIEHLKQAYGFEMVERNITFPVGVEDYDYDGWSTFHHAAASNDIEIMNDIINQEGFSHLESRTEFTDGHGFTPLLCAVKGNAIKSFNLLVSNGADIAAKDMNGNGIVEVAVLFGSAELFEHLLNDKYDLRGVDIWGSFMSMLFARDDEKGASSRKEAIRMAELLVNRDRRYVNSFIQCGGLGSIRDLLLESVNRPKETKKDKETETTLKEILKAEDLAELKDSLYLGALGTLLGVLRNITPDQGKSLAYNYKEIINILLRIVNRGKNGRDSYKEGQLAGDCLKVISGSEGWGVECLVNNCTISNLLRSVLLDPDSMKQFEIIETAYRKDKQTLLKHMSTSEIEVLLSILETEKRLEIKKFCIILLMDFFGVSRCKHLLYKEGVINTLLSGLGSPDTEADTISLQLLLMISTEEDGIKAIFKSANSFMHLVNQVLFETEDRFDMCCKLLWKLVQSFSNLQDSVKLIENIGLSTVVRMLESEDTETICVGCEGLKILLNSDKCDYRQHFVRKGVPQLLIDLLCKRNEGHVLYCVMTALSELCLAWSTLHPIPATQNAILQHDLCLEKMIRIANTSRFTSPSLQSASFLLIASLLLGNPVAESRLAEYDLDIEAELIKQSKHDEQSMEMAIKATSYFRYHSLLMDSSHFKFRCRFCTKSNTSIFNTILGRVCSGEDVQDDIVKLTKNADEEALIYLGSLAKLKGCAGSMIKLSLDQILEILRTGSLRKMESAATALASLSYADKGIEQLLIETHEDPDLMEAITRNSPNIPISGKLMEAADANSVREHRRRILNKSAPQPPTKLPDIGRNAVMTAAASGTRSPTKPKENGAKTPQPGDKTLKKIETVKYSDITRYGLTRPYSKVCSLPSILVQENNSIKPQDPELQTTLSRVYKKLYLLPTTSVEEISSRPGTMMNGGNTIGKGNHQMVARSLSFCL